ncbi:MAG TPA: GDP-mannose 4,6-dehydratase [Solirubrobacteraceae bacterium]|jgi:GDPmannose 4,6-dehydratase|nr:GDP-mannose 4,6-dehydratase [Solirubrobacteraceae bacterium]
MGARRALITGITGQDGSFLAELLLAKGYSVIGTIRGRASDPLGCSEHLRGEVSLVAADLEQPQSLRAAVAEVQPDELYHLAAPSFVPYSWQHPTKTLASIAGSTAALLEAVREHSKSTRTFVAASGAMFGDAHESPQRETTPCRPQTPYATAKLAAHHLVGQLRAHDGLFACSGILYNHESERRPERFVTRKITRAAAAIKLGLADHVALGDLDVVRDWSFAGDIVRGAWLMLQQDVPGDCILASGTPHTVSDLANAAFSHVGLDTSRYIRVDPSLVRATEATPQVGDPSRARERLGWQPTLAFEQLVQRMVEHDLQDLG